MGKVSINKGFKKELPKELEYHIKKKKSILMKIFVAFYLTIIPSTNKIGTSST